MSQPYSPSSTFFPPIKHLLAVLGSSGCKVCTPIQGKVFVHVNVTVSSLACGVVKESWKPGLLSNLLYVTELVISIYTSIRYAQLASQLTSQHILESYFWVHVNYT